MKRFIAYEIITRLKAATETDLLFQLEQGVNAADKKKGKLQIKPTESPEGDSVGTKTILAMHKNNRKSKQTVTNLLFISFSSFFVGCNSCEKWISNNERKESYRGYVTGKFLDTSFSGRNLPFIILVENNYKTEKYAVRNIFMYNNIDSGDYVYKDSGFLKRFLVKGNDTFMYYPQCGDGNDVMQ